MRRGVRRGAGRVFRGVSRHDFVGDLLLRSGVIDAAALTRARDVQKSGVSLAETIVDLGLATAHAVAEALAASLRLEFFDGDAALDAAMAALLPADFSRRRGAVPLGFDGRRLRVAVRDPFDYAVLQDVEFRTGKKAVAVVVTAAWMERALDAQEAAPAPSHALSLDSLAFREPAGEIEASSDTEIDLVDPAALMKDTQLPPIVRLVNLLLSDAAANGASDIHIEPQETTVNVRQRVDGLLREVMTIPVHLRDQVVSRLKIMSGMDIAERRKPQDGRSRLRYLGARIDLRVSTLPTQYGEKVVLRLLDSGRAILPLDELGLTPNHLMQITSFLRRPQGLILVTGPTGSGKTSTLYSALRAIKSTTNNVVTLEDPIELQLPGINQTQVNVKAGVTFADGLRSILRQDPNVILVGEIRDQETAGVALQAAQTGHLLLSTLHTNDATATITRLIDLGLQPFIVASSLTAVIAQRLVRRVCPGCARAQAPAPETVARLGGGSRLPAGAAWAAGAGCDKCNHSGYRGRLAIHELLTVDDQVRALIASGGSEQEIKAAAREAGMLSLLEDGIGKAAQGLTTLDEVLRVAAYDSLANTSDNAATAMPATAAAGQADQPAAATPEPVTPSDGDGRRRRVLVVEDSPTIVQVVKYFLENEGFDVVVASDGQEGLALALQDPPDIVVSDFNMPQMTGPAMIRLLRADPRTADVRVLMLTSESSVECETEGLEAGADDYILKPVEPRRLAARVKALLGRSRTRAA